jgi:DEAD/DEAH box helicase domain-containing protein
MISEIIFDIETKKLFDQITTKDPFDLGVSIVSLYKRQLDENLNEINGQILSFWEADFPKMWPLFSNVDRIIGFNSLSFDVPALSPLCSYSFKKLNHFDILEKIKTSLGFRLSLDAVAKETLGIGKTDVGTNAVLYWNQATPESLSKLQHYCEADVLITKDIYDYGLKNGHLKYKDKWNTPRIVEINFSYPKLDSSQVGLF